MVMDSMKAQRVVGQLFGPMLRGWEGGYIMKSISRYSVLTQKVQSGASIKVQILIKLLVQSVRQCLMSLPKKQY